MHPAVPRHVTEKVNKKLKGANLKPYMVKNHLWVFINCNVENPTFDSQVGRAAGVQHTRG